MERRYDLVIWGGTGFTGQLMAQHLAAHAPPNLRWTVAGRREDALKRVCSDLDPSLPSLPEDQVLVGEAQDAAAAAKIAKSTRLVLAAAGPFTKHSAAIRQACVEHGTHYVDITGEVVPYVRDSVLHYHEAAEGSGAKIVHCCGYDSVPSDLLSLLAIESLRNIGETCERVTVGFDLLGTVGELSGGTLGSICTILAHVQSTPTDVPDALDAFCLCSPAPPRTLASRLYDFATGGDSWFLPGWSAALGQWHFMFGMAACNTRIVRRSRALLQDVPASFAYFEVMTCGRTLLGLVIACVCSYGFLLGGLLLLPPVRTFLMWMLPAGTGPSKANQLSGRWRATVTAEGSAGGRASGEAVAVAQDPGYRSTAMMASQVALSVLEVVDAEVRGERVKGTYLGGGVLTPTSACGTLLVERFAKHGVTFDVTAQKRKAKGA